MLSLINTRLIPLFSFILGISICTSTSIMSISYATLAFLALFRPNLFQSLKSAIKKPFIFGALIFYLTFVCSILWTIAPVYDIYRMLLRIIGYLLAPLLFIAFLESKQQLKNQFNFKPLINGNAGKLLLQGFVIGALITAILSILSWATNHHILYGIQDNTWVVFHGHILHNAFLAIASSFLLWFIFDKNTATYERLWLIIAYLILFIDIIFVVNGRTGQVMLLIINAFLFIYKFRLKGLLAIIGLSIIIAPLLYLSPIVQKGINDYQLDMHKYNQGNSKTSVGLRLEFHKISKEIIKTKPVLGYGVGSFKQIYHNFWQAYNIPSLPTTNPHRDVFWVGVETGLLGIIAFGLMIILAFVNLIKLESFYRCMGLCLLIGYLSASIQNSFFIDNITGMAFIFIMLSLIVNGKKSQND